MNDTQARTMVATLATHAAHYDAFRRWCQRCWSGCAHGFELRDSTFDDAADRLLIAAEASGWIRRLSWEPRLEQRMNAAIGVCDRKRKTYTEDCEAVGLQGPRRPEHYNYEPVRESPAYCEFIAFIQLERCIFVPLVERWRQYAIETEKAELLAGHAVREAAEAKRRQERADRHKETTKRRAFAIRQRYRGYPRELSLLANACAAARPLVTEGPVAAQLRWVVARVTSWLDCLEAEPAWSTEDAREMAQ